MLASVILPTRSRPAKLARALASLLAQDCVDWEAIVVDDGAGEGIEVAESVGDLRITAIQSPGRGQVDARNAGIARARGRVVCWLDDDDWWEDPGHLALLRQADGSASGAAGSSSRAVTGRCSTTTRRPSRYA